MFNSYIKYKKKIFRKQHKNDKHSIDNGDFSYFHHMNTVENPNKKLILFVIVSMLTWGISWPSNKVLSNYGSAIDLGVYRYLLVILSMVFFFVFSKTSLKISKNGIVSVVVSGALMAVYNFTFLSGLQYGNPGAGGILVTTLNPVFAYGIGALLAWEKPRINEQIGLLFGLIAGLFLLNIWKDFSVFKNLGNTFFFLSAFIWAVISKINSKAADFGSPLAFSWWMYFATFLCLIPFANFHELKNMLSLNELKFWGNMLFSSVITTTLATTTYFIATSRIGAEKASSFIFLVPFTAGISAYFILGETLKWNTIVGGLFGIVAVYMLNRKKELKS